MAKKLQRCGLVATICLAVASTALKAEERQSAIVVWYGDSELYSFFVSDNPVLKVHDGRAVIQSDGTYEHQLETYTCLYELELNMEERDYTGYFDDGSATSVEEVPDAGTARPAFSLRGGILQVAGLAEGEQVTVASTDGKVIAQAKAGRGGQASVSLRGLAGTIVVKAGNVSFKVIVK